MKYRIGPVGLVCWLVLGVGLFSACEQPMTSVETDRRRAASADHCATAGLYGDGACDLDCPVVDPDCSDGDDSNTKGSRTEDSSETAETATAESSKPTGDESSSPTERTNDDNENSSDNDGSSSNEEFGNSINDETGDTDDANSSDDDGSSSSNDSGSSSNDGADETEESDDDNSSDSDGSDPDDSVDETDHDGDSSGDESGEGGNSSGDGTSVADSDGNESDNVPDDWSCSTAFYGDGTCDCGCGVVDVDCSSASSTECETIQGCSSTTVPLYDANYQCTSGDGWTCPQVYWEDSFCDCGCGLVDPDCDGLSSAYCEYDNCTGAEIHSTQNYLCETTSGDATLDEAVPDEWTCPSDLYDDGACDCGCGVVDGDCDGLLSSYCDFDNCAGDTQAHSTQNYLCETTTGDATSDEDVPDGWTCPSDYYDDGACDCGCGVIDSDCLVALSSACEYDNCAGGTEVHSTQNHLCVPEED